MFDRALMYQRGSEGSAELEISTDFCSSLSADCSNLANILIRVVSLVEYSSQFGYCLGTIEYAGRGPSNNEPQIIDQACGHKVLDDPTSGENRYNFVERLSASYRSSLSVITQ